MASEATGGGGGGGGGAGDGSGTGAAADGAVPFRRKDFKKALTTDDGRQRRSETTIQIRKNKRLEGLKKKRNVGSGGYDGGGADGVVGGGGDGAAGSTPGGAHTAPLLTMVPNDVTLENLGEFVRAANSEDPVAQFEGTKQIRRLLSKESDPPVVPVLHSGVVPRLAEFLGRLDNTNLQFEAAWALTNIASTEYTHVVVELGITPLLIRLLRSSNPDVREQCCWCLGNIAGDGYRFRDMVLEMPGAIENLVLNIAHPSSLSMLRNATWTLSNYCRGKPQPKIETTRQILPVLVHLLQSTDTEVLTDTCWALSYLSDGDDERIQTVVDAMAVPRLVTLMSHESTSVVNPALRAVGNIVTGNDLQTQAVIDSGALHAFVPLMQCSKRNIRKEACWAVSNVAAGLKEQVTALTKVVDLVSTVIHLLDKGEWKVKKEAAWAVSNMTITGGEEHIRVLVEAGCIPPLVDLLSVADNKICLVAMDALEAILKCDPAYADMVEENGGVAELEKLHDHRNPDVYTKSAQIIEKYFASDGVVTGEGVAPGVTQTGDGTNVFTFGGGTTDGGGGDSFTFGGGT